MNNRKYIYFGLLACVALLFFGHSNTSAVQNNLAAKGIILDGKSNDGTSFQRKDVVLGEESTPDPFADKGKRFYGTRPRVKDVNVFYLWIGYLNDMWYKAVLQDK